MKPGALMDWVNAGNTAILFCPFENAHLDGLGVDLGHGGTEGAEIRSTEAYPGQARRLRFASGARFVLTDSSVPTRTLFSSDGRPAVLIAPSGKGRFVLIADAHAATNLGLPEEDNALFLVESVESSLGGGEVIFDETSTRLSMGDPGVMAYARKSGLMPVFLELGVVALLVLWHVAARTAPPISRRAAPVPEVPDYVTGRARLYEKALMGRTTVQALAATVRDALHRSARMTDSERARGSALLDRASRLERLRVPKARELLDLARSIHDFMNEAIWKPGHRLRPPRFALWKRR